MREKRKVRTEYFTINHQYTDPLKEFIHTTKYPKSARLTIFLVDFNPHSQLFAKTQSELAALPFADQVRLFHGGFAMGE